MLPQTGSPARLTRSKRESFMITRSVGKALADVMNKDNLNDHMVGASSEESDTAGTSSSPARTKAAIVQKSLSTTTRDGHRAARPSLDVLGNDNERDKSTPKPMKRPTLSSTSKPTARSQSSATVDTPLSTTGGKSSRPRASLTLRGLSSALQPKPHLPPSALPKYKPKPTVGITLSIPKSGARKRLGDWDAEKVDEKELSNDEGTDDGFVNIDRPLSPLPRRAARKTTLPVSLSLSPAPRKKGNVLHKASGSLSSTPPRAPKAAKTSALSTSPIHQWRSSVPRPSSSASASSQRATPAPSTRLTASVSRTRTAPSARSVCRKPALVDSPLSVSSKMESSPGNPFQLPETRGSSLLSPPLSPFLEGVSLDSIDVGDVSALLSSVISPAKPSVASSETSRAVPPQTPSRNRIFPDGPNSPSPQTPVLSRPISTLTTDPRQSVLSLRQFLENSGDLEHLLSQPLPSILTPDARERLLSFGFSPGFVPPPIPAVIGRPEPQTPCPVSNERPFTSISQVLFPSASVQLSTEKHGPDTFRTLDETVVDANESRNLVELLNMQLISAESQRAERESRIEGLERQLNSLREAREREATELSAQVSDLEERLQELLSDKERDAERRTNELEMRGAEWKRHVTTMMAQERSIADREHFLRAEQRRECMRGVASAWECTREIACSELELVRLNRRFVEVILAGLDVSMQQLRRFQQM